MRRLQQRRSIAKFLCFLMILEMFVASPNVAEASVSKTISKNGREYCAVEGNKQTITVTLASPNKPENTKVVSSSVPSWASVSKPNYNSPVFKVTVQQNNGSGSRVENIEFTDGTNTWTLTLTQYVYKAPTTKPPTKPVTKEPTKKAPTPTKAPTSTPTPTVALSANVTALNFRADGETKTVTISGYSGVLRADRGDTWFTANVSGGTISVTATKNTSTARTSYLDVTDTGSGRSVRIQVNQAAPIYNPEPSKAPTSTPTPIPAETLPVKTKKLQFGAQGGQSTITLDEKTYNLRFSYPDNPSVPTGWVTMSYENGKIIVKVKQNKNHAPRSMKVTITDRNTNQYAYVTINQSAAPTPTPAFLSVDREEISCESNGGEEIVTVKGKVGTLGYDFTWEPADNNDWVKVKPEGNNVRFIIDENRTIKARTAIILIKDSQTKKDVTVTIKQEAMSNTVKVIKGDLTAEERTVSFGCWAEKKTMKIYGNIGMIRVERIGSDTWFSATVTADTVEISVKENTGLTRRGYLNVIDSRTLKSIRMEIIQDARPPQPLEVDHRALAFSAEKENQKIVVSGRVGILSLNRRKNANWFTAREENGYIVVEVEENTGAPRTGYLDISDKATGDTTWVAIYQNSKTMDMHPLKKDYTPACSVDGLQFNYSWKKASEVIPLTSQDYYLSSCKYEWNQEKTKYWAHIRFDKEKLYIDVDENYNVDYRSVTISLYSRVYVNGTIKTVYPYNDVCVGKITITQEGAPLTAPRLTAEHEVLTFGTNGGTQEVFIFGLSGTPTIKKKSDVSWLKIEEIGPTLKKDERVQGYLLSFSATENFGGERKGEISIVDTKTGQQIGMTVYQAPAPGKEGKSDSDTEIEDYPADCFSSDEETRSIYLIKYDANGGTDAPPTQYKGCYEDELILTSSIPKRLGYDFLGWGLLPTSTWPAYKPGDKYNRNTDVTLYAVWRPDGFWNRFEITHDIREPYNSAVAGAKNGITMDKYWKIFYERKETYIRLCDPAQALWNPNFVDIMRLEEVANMRDRNYIANIRARLLTLNTIGVIGKNAPIIPDAAHFLGYYLSAKGGKVTYGLHSYLEKKNPLVDSVFGDGNVVTRCFNHEVNYIMREMEKGLHENQSIVVTEKNAGKNKISFTNESFSDIYTDAKFNLNGFLGIKEGTYGLSAKCSYDGEYYTMEVCFYLQDFYDFYYEADDWNNQGKNWMAFVYVDELAFLVPWGFAKPFENTGILHTKIVWKKGQSANLDNRVSNPVRLYTDMSAEAASLYVYPDK